MRAPLFLCHRINEIKQVVINIDHSNSVYLKTHDLTPWNLRIKRLRINRLYGDLGFCVHVSIPQIKSVVSESQTTLVNHTTLPPTTLRRTTKR